MYWKIHDEGTLERRSNILAASARANTKKSRSNWQAIKRASDYWSKFLIGKDRMARMEEHVHRRTGSGLFDTVTA